LGKNAEFFGENILEITTSVPDPAYRIQHIYTTFFCDQTSPLNFQRELVRLARKNRGIYNYINGIPNDL
jgi:hypothetical protein